MSIFFLRIFTAVKRIFRIFTGIKYKFEEETVICNKVLKNLTIFLYKRGAQLTIFCSIPSSKLSVDA